MAAKRAETLVLDFSAAGRRPLIERQTVRIGTRELAVTPVFGAYWRFAAERQNIFFRRLDGPAATRFTEDPILTHFKFTNAYRASDRVSQFLIRNVIYREDLPRDATNIFFRVLLFKLFNKIETWLFLERAVGELTWESFKIDRFDAALYHRKAEGERIYSAAYIMPSAGSAYGHPLKHKNHLCLLEHLIRNEFPARLSACASMAEAYELLLSAPSLGPFLAYQYATDLNYSTLMNFSESEFVVAGPGALDGINKCFVGANEVHPSEVIRYMYDRQEEHFAEQGISFRSLWGRSLQLIDCQNLFCEISKYARVAYPQYEGAAGRTRIKQRFAATAALPNPWYPPKWGINHKIETN